MGVVKKKFMKKVIKQSEFNKLSSVEKKKYKKIFLDENFHNAMEHVELTDRIAREGMTLSFSMFVDIADSDKYLSEIEGSIQNSSIRPNVEDAQAEKKFRANILDALEYWAKKDGHRFPLWDLLFSYRRNFG